MKEQEAIVVKEHKKTPRKPGVRKEMLADLPKEIEEYIINPEEKCSVCGGELKVIGKEIVRTEVEFQPATLIVKQIVRQIAKCTVCGSDGNDRPAHMQKASVPAKVLPHSIATHSLVAQIMYQKFEMGAPFARLEKDFYRMGLDISRANMAYWTIRCSDEWLMPVYNRIHQILIQKCEILHMDETRIQVNKESGKKASSDSFMWVLQRGACEDYSVATRRVGINNLYHIFYGGIQLFSMGIMGQYIAKNYTESKKRPHYIITETNDEDTKLIN